jgi:chemotaxis protein methyltransferase CheR
MAKTLTKQLQKLRQLITERTGLYFLKTDSRDFQKLIKPAFLELGSPNLETGLDWLLSSPIKPDHFQVLINHLTIGETYFLRNKPIYQALEQTILPDLMQRKHQEGKMIRIWSAACSTGEEPYSIAITLKKSIPDIQNWGLTILATDINDRSIKKAIHGVYSEWSFRDAPSWLKSNYFSTKGSHFEIDDEIKKMVTFKSLNLKEDVYPAPQTNTHNFDIIFCQNVLMYFNHDTVQEVIDRLQRSLNDKGLLIVSPGDGGQLLLDKFKLLNFHGGMLYQKKDQMVPC